MARAICCLEGGWTTAVGEAMVRSTSHLVRTVAITERPLLAKFASETAPIQMVSPRAAFVLVILALLLIWFGVYPSPLLNLTRTTTAGPDFTAQIRPH